MVREGTEDIMMIFIAHVISVVFYIIKKKLPTMNYYGEYIR